MEILARSASWTWVSPRAWAKLAELGADRCPTAAGRVPGLGCGSAPHDDVPAIGWRYRRLVREGRFAEAEKVAKQALEMPACAGCGIGASSRRGDVALCEACAWAREDRRT